MDVPSGTCGAPAHRAQRKNMPLARAACVCAILALCSMDVPKCRGAAPPLETPFPDWDRGAGEGATCTVVQDGRSGDHVPYFRWSGDQVPVCVEPARDPGSTCLNTEQSVCKKTCDASKSDGSGDSVSCTGFCRCEPECGGQCETACCRLAFDLKPPGCKVLRYDCDFRHTILERSECNATSNLCTCAAGHCGYNVSQDGHMVCAEGFGAPCMPCPTGSYKPSLSLAACSPCSQGYSTRTAGATRREECEPLCKNGSSSATGFEPCVPCAQGTFQPGIGRTSCHECPFGSNTTGRGSTSEEDCCRACDHDWSASSALTTGPSSVLALLFHMVVVMILIN